MSSASHPRTARARRLVAAVFTAAMLTACGGADDGAGVREIGPTSDTGTGTGTGSGTGTATGSATGTGTGSATGTGT